MMRVSKCLGVSAAAMIAAYSGGTVSAQEGEDEEDVGRRQIEEITVTAQRREEGLQDVPVAVSAFSQDDFVRQNFNEITDLRFAAPNVNIQKSTGLPNGAQVFIRGVGQDDSAITAETGVGIYLDGVYLGKQNGTTLDLVEFERVELLRGPQGTYYGRNTNGGAIKFVTRRPELEEARYVGDVRFGTDATADIRGSASAPLIQGELGLKIDGFFRHRNSDFDLLNEPNPTPALTFEPEDKANDLLRGGGRASLLWEPTADVSVYATADYTVDESGSFLPTPIQRADTRGTADPNDDLIVEPFGRRAGEFSLAPFHELELGGASLQVDWDTPLGTITSISAYRFFSDDLALDLDGPGILDVYQEVDQNQFSQEVQLLGDYGNLEYIFGLYYFREDAEILAENAFNRIFAGIFGLPFGLNDDDQLTNSYAVFGELSYTFFDQLTLTAGARFTRDEKEADRAFLDTDTRAPIFDVDADFEDDDISPRFVAEWRATPDVMVYASYSQGYKAGGFAGSRPLTASNAQLTYIPEELTAYEIGAKTEFFDGRLRFNPTYFFSDYQDLQLSVLDPATFQFTIINADADIQGIEIEAEARPTDNLRAFTSIGWTDFEYAEGDRSDPAVGVPFSTLEGKQFPEFAVRSGLIYTQSLGFAPGAFEAGVFVTYNSEIFRNVANDPSIRSEAETLVDLYLAYTLDRDNRYRVQLDAKNITNEDYFLAGTNAAAGPGGLGGRYYAPDRQITLNIRATL